MTTPTTATSPPAIPATSLAEAGIFTPNWAVLATEFSVIFFLFAVIIGIIAWLGRRKRIKAARLLLDERENLAASATETFNQHCLALRPDRPWTEAELDDYEQRSLSLVGELIQPWLEPATDTLRQATREIMTIRHNDLHQIAAIFRSVANPEPSHNAAQDVVVEQLQHDLAASQKAESERSAQLAEALKSVSIIVGEYGRKFGVDADFKVPQILRALLYLQATDEGLDPSAAKRSADEAMANGIIFSENFAEITEETSVESTPVNSSQSPKSAPIKPDPIEKNQTEVAISPEVQTPPISAPAPQVQSQTAPIERTKTEPDEPPAKPAIRQPAPTQPPIDENLIDLDEIELPIMVETRTDFDLDLDDIDALLDAEIARQQTTTAPAANTLPTLDDELDLSKKT
ncbi:MAG: hypothetical protein ACYC3A_07705 [Halothiobacillus sp.]